MGAVKRAIANAQGLLVPLVQSPHRQWKERQLRMNDLVCYCFEYTAKDIQEDVRANDGRSLILEEIVVAKKAGGCNCATTHPEGR